MDVLVKNDKLYQGELADKFLAADGALLSVTLKKPSRFDREGYNKAKEAGTPQKEQYWRPIPTTMFIIMGGEISSINLRYLPKTAASMKLPSSELNKLLNQIAHEVEALRQAQIKISTDPDVAP
jgi:hypothetical protein